MLSEDRYFQTLSEKELWQRYCGFLYLDVPGFMAIQERLLMDQIDRVSDSVLGKKIMKNGKPGNIEQFRRDVPLTTYDDYETYLSQRREDALAEKPYFWWHSAGRAGYFKWIPQSREVTDKLVRNLIASFILSSTNREGQVNVSPGFRLLSILPPRPYGSGWLLHFLQENLSVEAMPPQEEAEDLDFEERIRRGVQIALRDGMDFTAATSSILVKMGEALAKQSQAAKLAPYMLHPKIMLRALRARARARKERRPVLPKDLWRLSGIVTGGMDTSIYKKDIVYYWGCEPYEFYISTDANFMAMQAWNKKALTFLPDSVFFEFIPQEELTKERTDPSYRPQTVLLSEMKEGVSYEVVITHFYGMPFLRYRMKDIIKVISLREEELGITLPQVVFQRRAGETIYLASLAEFDEKTIWQAIAGTGVKCVDWAACKEYEAGKTFVRLYLELGEEREESDLETMLDHQFKVIDPDYKDLDYFLGLQPIRVTLLNAGTFDYYLKRKKEEGCDLAHLKPRRVNPSDEEVQNLINWSGVIGKKN